MTTMQCRSVSESDVGLLNSCMLAAPWVRFWITAKKVKYLAWSLFLKSKKTITRFTQTIGYQVLSMYSGTHLCLLFHNAACWKYRHASDQRQTVELWKGAGNQCGALSSSEAGTCNLDDLCHVLHGDELLLWWTAVDRHQSAVAIVDPTPGWFPSCAALDPQWKACDVLPT